MLAKVCFGDAIFWMSVCYFLDVSLLCDIGTQMRTPPDQNFALRHAGVIHAALTPQGNRGQSQLAASPFALASTQVREIFAPFRSIGLCQLDQKRVLRT